MENSHCKSALTGGYKARDRGEGSKEEDGGRHGDMAGAATGARGLFDRNRGSPHKVHRIQKLPGKFPL